MTMNEYALEAISAASFHGEDWYRCQRCGFQFEFYDAMYERYGIKKAPEFSDENNGRFWEHRIFICPKCGKKFKIS